MRAWIFGAVDTLADDAMFYRRLRFGDDLIICADGGYNTAAMLGITPHIVIGDMDSLRRRIAPHVQRQQHPKEKDKTDLDLCIDYALEQGCGEIVLLSVFGGRIDHTIAALVSLRRIMERGAKGMLLTRRSKVFLIDGETRIKRGEYKKISLIPVTDRARGVTTRGMKYPLENATLVQTENLGLSNEFYGPEATVSLTEGVLCVACEMD